jgi:hypothetical protein
LAKGIALLVQAAEARRAVVSAAPLRSASASALVSDWVSVSVMVTASGLVLESVSASASASD